MSVAQDALMRAPEETVSALPFFPRLEILA